MKMQTNDKLHRAKRAKGDEFYTPREYVEELLPYLEQFRNANILCPCDSAESFYYIVFTIVFLKGPTERKKRLLIVSIFKTRLADCLLKDITRRYIQTNIIWDTWKRNAGQCLVLAGNIKRAFFDSFIRLDENDYILTGFEKLPYLDGKRHFSKIILQWKGMNNVCKIPN